LYIISYPICNNAKSIEKKTGFKALSKAHPQQVASQG